MARMKTRRSKKKSKVLGGFASKLKRRLGAKVTAPRRPARRGRKGKRIAMRRGPRVARAAPGGAGVYIVNQR